MSSKQRNTGGKKHENEHIPRYIKTKPWFYGEKGKDGQADDYLEHHRQDPTKKNLFDIDNNGVSKLGRGIVDSFKDGSRPAGSTLCENCGARGHLKRDCLERPRKVPAVQEVAVQSSNVKIRDDEKLDWDAKKDRWFGYSGEDYDAVLDKWGDRVHGATLDDGGQGDQYDTDEEVELTKLGLLEEFKERRAKRSQVTKGNGVKASIRLREDKAAYLNDINSSETRYDPKSRIYKDETVGSIDEKSKMFRRYLTGEGAELDELNKFSRTYAKQAGVRDEVVDAKKIEHVLIANPTKYEAMLKKQKRSDKESGEDQEVEIDYTKLQAQKLSGTKQDGKRKRMLQDMYD
ncbi:mRNA splicing protein SLU7 KNAG_0H02940 [Huiozyma naganishii CBS 8797]|uniref:Pre-mRNA-splicing factor SLU7 n=1 Tax=Huiozyma naganishii (strain ATCC MYA-139 / BCRC 22969 / CBS 8797 / KCTC 17520 / NBRC 10181 / NCYC 3082 / Yp74L-3) TaxID=1071383 RepID=J7S8S1_HUIN7|nr:hypothetical protein KNAG_0H02940 [Kazachstania naganishii CBS 8797]CCK71709.1 hypothetical protein KNAG_0H02940 [Kazachstania naganishii CBS 8797]